MNIKQGNGRTVVNGVEINAPKGASISIINNQIYVNGKPYNDERLNKKEIVQLVINGDVGSIKTDVDVICRNVNGDIDCGRDCDIKGDVSGNIIAGRDIDCKNIGGSAKAGRDICH